MAGDDEGVKKFMVVPEKTGHPRGGLGLVFVGIDEPRRARRRPAHDFELPSGEGPGGLFDPEGHFGVAVGIDDEDLHETLLLASRM